jgi:hypothetical protein
MACGRPKVAYETGIGAAAVSSTTPAATSTPASDRAISATAGSARQKNASDGSRSPSRLGVPLSQVVSFGTRPRLSGACVDGLQASTGLRQDVREAAQLVAADGEWSVYSIDCPATARPSPAARSAGVWGGSR